MEEGDLTQDELKKMEMELQDFAPADIRARVDGIEWSPPSVKDQFDAVSGSTPAAIHNPIRALDHMTPG